MKLKLFITAFFVLCMISKIIAQQESLNGQEQSSLPYGYGLDFLNSIGEAVSGLWDGIKEKSKGSGDYLTHTSAYSSSLNSIISVRYTVKEMLKRSVVGILGGLIGTGVIHFMLKFINDILNSAGPAGFLDYRAIRAAFEFAVPVFLIHRLSPRDWDLIQGVIWGGFISPLVVYGLLEKAKAEAESGHLTEAQAQIVLQEAQKLLADAEQSINQANESEIMPSCSPF
ncbi:MAG TPA: hypothetical protein VHA52_02025 [Candidatus Babeliaceae bacterium]|nr:hypothetical protein [Candidatus Babeliaceae bacterium]